MSKFKVGDKVRIKENLKVGCRYNNGCFFDQEMEKYKGKAAVIKAYHMLTYLKGNVEIKNASKYIYILDIDDGYWYWSSSMLEKVEDKKHFKSLPRDFTGTIDVEKGFITNIAEKEILDEVEKEYLSAVIKPFKKIITGIVVNDILIGEPYLSIKVRGNDEITFPCFKKGTMYKNMKTNREYTLKELGLD